MISIPISETSHAIVRTLSKWLCVAAFIVVAGSFGLSGIAGYRQASAILKDYSVVEAPVHLDSIEEHSGRKGRVSHSYHFRYTFEAGGKEYAGTFETSEDNARPYVHYGSSVRVAYANADPARFERLQKLEGNSRLGPILQRLLVALILLGVLSFVVHLLITRRLFVAQPLPAAPAA